MNKIKIIFYLAISISLLACHSTTPDKSKVKKSNKKQVVVPAFNSDSAYQNIKQQLDFGFRIPNTPEHEACAAFLSKRIAEYADTVIVQSFKTRAYDGTILHAKNIIGVFNPEKGERVVLTSHWDSRPFADHDPDPKLRKTPVDAANDGASGVGILLEMARLFHAQKPEIGVDIVFFDVEDYGPPQDYPKDVEGDFWGLGSQYWSSNPHVYGYTAKFGILLDMVGAKDARFYMEGFSMAYAAGPLKKVWKKASALGYGDYFIFQQKGYIDDDHKYMNEIAGIPTIDIIHLDDNSTNHSFFEHWHTTHDKLNIIDKKTLQVVGNTLMHVVYEE